MIKPEQLIANPNDWKAEMASNKRYLLYVKNNLEFYCLNPDGQCNPAPFFS